MFTGPVLYVRRIVYVTVNQSIKMGSDLSHGGMWVGSTNSCGFVF